MKKIRIYVSGRYSFQGGVRKAIQKLTNAGFSITFDWTKMPKLRPYKDHPKLSKKFAQLELNTIDISDAFLLVSDKSGTGMYTEMGYAIAKGKPIYVIGAWNERSIFFFHPLVKKFETIEEVISDLKNT